MATFSSNGLTFNTTGSGGANVTGPGGINFYVEDVTDPASVQTAISRAASSPNITPSAVKTLQNISGFTQIASSGSAALNAGSDAAAASQQTAATTNTNQSDDTARASQTRSGTNTDATPISAQEQKNVSKPTGNAETTESKSPVPVATPKAVTSYTQEQLDVVYRSQLKNGTTALGGNKSTTFKASPNPLDAYASYTYGITLHVLTREDYNTMVGDPKKFTPTKTLISSAGRYSESGQEVTGPRSWKNVGRDLAFKEDFYFDSLKFDTIIGLNANARGTNVLTLDFTIIEPYGMTLMDRLMDVNNVDLNGKNYLEMPYLLEINFFGTDNTGKSSKISDQTKWIPIKLTGLKIKASVKGSEYQISAVPFNHAANMETVQSIKTRIHVTAETVGDYFSMPKTDTGQDDNNQGDASAAASGMIAEGNPGLKNDNVRTGGVSTSTVGEQITVNANSFVAAYNEWYAAEHKKGNIGQPDFIEVKFDESSASELSTSKIVDAKKNSIRRIGGTNAQTAAKSNERNDTATVNFNSIVHDLEPGTKINDILNVVLSQSKYFLDQVIDSSSDNKEAKANANDSDTAAAQAKPLKMWKIVPTIKLLKFDNERNQWAKKITFLIGTYNVYQQRDDRLPQSPPPDPVKRYDYFYTGHNTSIINFDIDFNALYYTAKSVDRGATTAGAGTSQTSEENKNSDKTDNNADKGQIQPEVQNPVSGDQNASAGGGSQRSETLNARSAIQSIYTSAAGDMINLKMQIIGDPELIKQDDLFVNFGNTNNSIPVDASSPYVPGTKSIAMDRGEIYSYVTFRTPSDFDDKTGMYNLNSSNKYAVSEFSGYYKMIKVTNEFRAGKFTQTLDLIRQPRQKPINKSKSTSTDVKQVGDAERKKTFAEDHRSGNPAVSANNVNPAPDPSTPSQRSPSETASSGVDGDGKSPANSTANQPGFFTKLSGDIKQAFSHFGNGNSESLNKVAESSKTYDVSQSPPTD